MRTSHALLLRLYHDPSYHFAEVMVLYVNRGAPNDLSSVTGADIRHLDSDYLEINSPTGITPIPYHRIREIRYRKQLLWDRSHRSPKKHS